MYLLPKQQEQQGQIVFQFHAKVLECFCHVGLHCLYRDIVFCRDFHIGHILEPAFLKDGPDFVREFGQRVGKQPFQFEGRIKLFGSAVRRRVLAFFLLPI